MIHKIFVEHSKIIEDTYRNCEKEIERFALLCQDALKNGYTIFFCGNGGSAADAQHIAAELVGRFQRERNGLPALALTTDTSILTAVSNDYGFEQVFARQVQALVGKNDVVVGISTSGNSPNVVCALEIAKNLGANTVGMTGSNGGRLNDICDVCIKVPSEVTARIQETHILIGHVICQYIDEVDYGDE
ncbi:MAG TPA: D-sedoheptulose 7-phosphate isomerase [Bacillota bacterium]|nr:D-sedoheptulose 7-phosphate isomerase [Bacillota bacterium]